MEEVLSEIFSTNNMINHIGHQIFELLDNKTLKDCRLVAKYWNDCLISQKLPAFRLIKSKTNIPDTYLWTVLKNMANLDDVSKLVEHVCFSYKLQQDYFSPFQKEMISDFSYRQGRLLSGTPEEIKIRKHDLKINPFIHRLPNLENLKINEYIGRVLHEAAINNHFDVYQLIVENITQKSPKDSMGYAPFHHAAIRGHLETCRVIIKTTNETNPKDNNGKTPFHHAARCGHLEICQEIIKISTEKNPKDDDGKTPFHDAARCGHLKVCEEILKIAAETNPKDNDGVTPLHHAVENGHFEVCQLILANMNEKNTQTGGMTPFEWQMTICNARRNSTSEICDLITYWMNLVD